MLQQNQIDSSCASFSSTFTGDWGLQSLAPWRFAGKVHCCLVSHVSQLGSTASSSSSFAPTIETKLSTNVATKTTFAARRGECEEEEEVTTKTIASVKNKYKHTKKERRTWFGKFLIFYEFSDKIPIGKFGWIPFVGCTNVQSTPIDAAPELIHITYFIQIMYFAKMKATEMEHHRELNTLSDYYSDNEQPNDLDFNEMAQIAKYRECIAKLERKCEWMSQNNERMVRR